MKRFLLPLVAILALASSCSNNEEIRRETIERFVKEARPHIEFMQKIDTLIKEHGIYEPYLYSANQKDAAFKQIRPMILRDMRHFMDSKSRNSMNSSSLRQTVYFINCNERVNHDGDTLHYNIMDLALKQDNNIQKFQLDDGFGGSSFYLTDDQFRVSLERCLKGWNGDTISSPLYNVAKESFDIIARRHKNFKYLAFLKNIYEVDPVIYDTNPQQYGSSYDPGFIATRVTVYEIETGSLYKEFVVYVTNSDVENYFQFYTTDENGVQRELDNDNPLKFNLKAYFYNELMYQLRENGVID